MIGQASLKKVYFVWKRYALKNIVLKRKRSVIWESKLMKYGSQMIKKTKNKFTISTEINLSNQKLEN